MVLDVEAALKLDRELEESTVTLEGFQESLSKLTRESLVKLMVAMDQMIKEALTQE